MKIELEVDGVAREADVEATTSLLNVLRDELELTATKGACDEGECGACAVWLDGVLVCSCLVPAIQADGSAITTVEALATDGALHPVQQAFVAAGAVQCGFCTPGMVSAAVDLLAHDAHPDDAAVAEALSGHLCRCTGYRKIVAAVHAAAERTS